MIPDPRFLLDQPTLTEEVMAATSILATSGRENSRGGICPDRNI
jgi:hypothetical protein